MEKNLVLFNFILNLLGFSDYSDLLSLLKNSREGYSEDGNSFFFNMLISQPETKLPPDKLANYDYNIKNYLETINQKRVVPIQLKYFQYLAILFTEIYLDQLFNNTKLFLKELNQFVISEFKDKMDFLFSRDSLNKLAFWMATGSGKTLILHINYLQFLNYNSGPERIDFDNIILITPNENLSKQHYNELRKSSLNCEIFQQSQQGYFSSLLDPNMIKIIDIHKLTEEKKGKGVTIDVEFFGGKNIIFVDEGHKGSGGEKWKKCRERISEEGFTFEYSATFGQAVNRPSNQQEALLKEYAKSIIFDYSYHYFHDDGFGKDYRILNLKKNVYEDSKETLMLANLLSFFEQKLLFEQHKDIAKTYQIEEPLWIFVGS
ncbi:MAG: DEAD/DEAH box helicase family protein, partial [Promethearchaeota archaeon]